MTIKGTDVIGLNIVTVNTGETIDKVTDVIYDPTTNQVSAILVDEGGWFKEARVLLISNVKAIGKDAVMIESAEVIQKASEVPSRIASIADDSNHLTKDKVLTEDGTDLGQVSDIFFEFPGGKVTNLEVSQGLIKNIGSGKKHVNTEDIITVGQNALIVSKYTEAAFETQAQSQGLQGAANTTGEKFNQAKEKAGQWTEESKFKAAQMADTAKVRANLASKDPKVTDTQTKITDGMHNIKDKTQETFNSVKDSYQSGEMESQVKQGLQNVKEKASEVWDKTKSAVGGKANDTQQNITAQRAKSALGKQLGDVTILTTDDEVIARPGDLITHEIIEKARENGMLDHLLNNVA